MKESYVSKLNPYISRKLYMDFIPKQSLKLMKEIHNYITIQRRWRYILKQRLLKSNLYITPIKKTYNKKFGKPCSKKDWEEQELREKNNEPVMWDGPPLNITQPRVNDIMSIWKHNKHVIMYKITDVYSSKCRLDSWSMNIGQRDRRVIYLQKLMVINWETWIELGGPSRCMGTTILKKSRDNLISYIHKTISKKC